MIITRSNQGPKGDTGPAGPQGPAGSGGDLSFVFTQASPSASWTITHNLGKRPGVTIVDSAESVVIGDITYIDDNSLRVDFSGAFSGAAYLN